LVFRFLGIDAFSSIAKIKFQMRILLTNDDGITASGLKALAEELQKEFEIEVVAPDRERSASSHSITFRQPLWVSEIMPHWRAVTGTSVDCVNLAVNGLLKNKPDLVVSGINRGANLGCDIFYSGTVAGAREAGILGIPAFAISVEYRIDREIDYKPSARFAKRFIHFLKNNSDSLMSNPRVIFNINLPGLPEEEIKGVRWTRQGIRIYQSQVWEREDPRGHKYYWLNGSACGGKPIEDSDIIALDQGYISITPLELDFTDQKLLALLKNSFSEDFF